MDQRFRNTESRFGQTNYHQGCCRRVEMQIILPILLFALFGVVLTLNYWAGGFGIFEGRQSYVLSFNISFYLADAPWVTFLGMVVMVFLFVPYAVNLQHLLQRDDPDNEGAKWFCRILTVVIVVGFFLVGIFRCDMSFENGTLHWDKTGAWRMLGHGLGAFFAFFGLAVYDLGAAIALHCLVQKEFSSRCCACDGHDLASAVLMVLGILSSCLVFVCAYLNQVVWNVTQVTNLHTYWTDGYHERGTGVLAKCSLAEYGIIIFALLGMFFNGLQVYHYEKNLRSLNNEKKPEQTAGVPLLQ